MKVGVAISTTGDEHRLDLLRDCVKHWDEVLGVGEPLFVTVDGDEAAVRRVAETVDEWTGSVFRVGQPVEGVPRQWEIRDGRLGVAANKNTGLELLMVHTRISRFFLSDDDTWPRGRDSLNLHTDVGEPHSMVCWGRHRRSRSVRTGVASWTWPRGTVLYVTRDVVAKVGGMIEAFGPGGHEHVEWSRRIHQAGFTPEPYISPVQYIGHNYRGAAVYWHVEDMARPGENIRALVRRREHLTSVRRRAEDERLQARILADMDGVTEFVPFRAAENGRESATLYPIAGA